MNQGNATIITGLSSSIGGWLCSVFTGAHTCNRYAGLPAQNPHKCPCCDGWGEREVGGLSATVAPKETCKACGGSGVVWG